MIRVAIIGAGNLAWSLIKGLSSSEEICLVGVVARKQEVVNSLREELGVAAATSIEELPAAQLYIIAVSDSAVEQVSGSMNLPEGAVVAHTAGTMPLSALDAQIVNRAVFYPLQSFTSGYSVDWQQIPIFIEGDTPQATDMVQRVASTLSTKVYSLSSQERVKLHLAAVFASNFTNAMLGVASEHLADIDLPLSTLTPLLEQTLRKATESQSPAEVQTGPAVRGDMVTQQSHLELMSDKQQQDIYKLISSMIWKISRRN